MNPLHISKTFSSTAISSENLISLFLFNLQVALISALVAVCQAGILVEQNQGHHAVSSQSIVRHDQPSHQQNIHYATPVLTHSAPILTHSAPVLTHSANILTHSAPIVQHSQILSHSAPLVHHAPVAVGHAQVHQVEEHVSSDLQTINFQVD